MISVGVMVPLCYLSVSLVRVISALCYFRLCYVSAVLFGRKLFGARFVTLFPCVLCKPCVLSVRVAFGLCYFGACYVVLIACVL